ncbi:hypothetical protein AXF23_15235 [Prevotella sp. oral taxon 313]|nr:hypothetical protein AXF23_15235 [Prevotella sp. oral taxon 313]
MPLYVSYAVRAAHCTNSVNAIFVDHLVHSISCEVMILGYCFQPSLVVFYFLDHFLFRFAIFFRAHHRRVFFFFFFFFFIGGVGGIFFCFFCFFFFNFYTACHQLVDFRTTTVISC